MVEGRLVYQGKSSQAPQYFESMGFKVPEFHNPADYFMSIIHHESKVNVANYPKYFENYNARLLPAVSNEIKSKRTSQVPSRS